MNRQSRVPANLADGTATRRPITIFRVGERPRALVRLAYPEGVEVLPAVVLARSATTVEVDPAPGGYSVRWWMLAQDVRPEGADVSDWLAGGS